MRAGAPVPPLIARRTARWRGRATLRERSRTFIAAAYQVTIRSSLSPSAPRAVSLSPWGRERYLPGGVPSQRSRVPASENRLFRILSDLRAESVDLYDLTGSNPTTAGIEYDPGVILEPLGDPRGLTYRPHPLGIREAREAVAAEWGRRGLSAEPSRIVITSSTSEAYAHCFKLFCDPGDEVIVPRPSYPLFDELARYEGVRLAPYRVDYDGAWHIDLDSVRRALGPRTRAILAVSPNNPTGSRLTTDELHALGGLGLPLIVDEVFCAYPLDAPELPSLLALGSSAPVVVLDGLSKLAGLPQMKVGWMTLDGPQAIIDDWLVRLELMLDAFLSVGTPAQLALERWLRTAPRTRAAIQRRLESNLGVLRAAFEGSAASVPKIDGGWYAMVLVPSVLTDDEWAMRLLREEHVFVHPGWLYDATEAPWLVLSLLTEPERFREGVRRLAAFVGHVSTS
jgi:alanine-synthesizing transaminase